MTSRNPLRRSRLAPAAAATAAGTLVLALIAPGFVSAAHAVTVPGNLKVARTGDGTDLAIGWSATSGVDHYTVNVFDGFSDRATVVPGTASSFLYDGSGVCTRYQVRVTAVGTDGTIAATSPTFVGSLAPYGVATMTARRTESGASGAVAWTAPRSSGASALTAFTVRVSNMATGAAVLSTKVTPGTTSVALSSLDPARRYSAKVTPVNAYGSCSTSTTLLYGATPSQPLTFQVDRDPATPSQLALSWAPPSWAGYGPVTEYEVGYGDLRITRWVRTTGRSLALTLSPNVNHVFAVRAISSNDIGSLTRALTLAKVGAPGTPVVDPKVTVDEADGTVTVTASGPVGTSAAYPKMRISIDPTIKGTWRDEHVVSNGASLVTFSQVPCGVFTVLVTGYGNGAEREFGRKVLNRCDSGVVPSERWKVVYGSAKIAGDLVDVTAAGERRIMSTLTRTTRDMVLTTTAHLHTGWGYGIWARADVSAGGSAVSGYSMQYDPGYGKVSSFGPALLLRLWSKGTECGTPLAKVAFPAGVETYAPHQFTVVVKGDALYATIDGKTVFNVPSLAAAVKANGCGMPAPTGTEIGFRTWNDTTATFTGTTLN